MSDLLDRKLWVIQQKKHWGEILVGWETKNKYAIHAEDGRELGYIVEEGSGVLQFLKRLILRGHRPFTALVLDLEKKPILKIRRPWFWFFSSTYVDDGNATALGAVHRRFRLLSRRYDIKNESGGLLGHVHAGFFRIWKFDLLDASEKAMGTITKKWGGILKEAFTDADRFAVVLDGNAPQESRGKAVILGAAIALDFDYFEDNQSQIGILGSD
ncbi:MAG: scramblase [Elusimicrobia bacterium]|nr:scramblase [Elusimicrobiota bacterium]